VIWKALWSSSLKVPLRRWRETNQKLHPAGNPTNSLVRPQLGNSTQRAVDDVYVVPRPRPPVAVHFRFRSTCRYRKQSARSRVPNRTAGNSSGRVATSRIRRRETRSSHVCQQQRDDVGAFTSRSVPGITGCQTIDKVGRLLWAWFSCPEKKSADKIVERTADFVVCNFVRYQLASRIHNSRMQIAKWCLHYVSVHLVNENEHYRITNKINN